MEIARWLQITEGWKALHFLAESRDLGKLFNTLRSERRTRSDLGPCGSELWTPLQAALGIGGPLGDELLPSALPVDPSLVHTLELAQQVSSPCPPTPSLARGVSLKNILPFPRVVFLAALQPKELPLFLEFLSVSCANTALGE